MNKRICFFIGHRDTSERLLPILEKTVEKHITNYGVTEFVVGHYGSFDSLAAQAVIRAKQNNPKIGLFLLLPYHPSERSIEVPAYYNGTIHPEGIENVPRKLAIVYANKYMVEHSDYLIAYAHRVGSNAVKIAEYAKKREKKGLIRVTMMEEV